MRLIAKLRGAEPVELTARLEHAAAGVPTAIFFTDISAGGSGN